MDAARADEVQHPTQWPQRRELPSVSAPSSSSPKTGTTWSTFQDGIIWTWLGNSVLYTGVALVITLVVTIPAGYALGDDRLQASPDSARLDAHGDAHPEHGARAADLPRDSMRSTSSGRRGRSSCRSRSSRSASTSPTSTSPRAISHDLLDAARIDGAGEFRVFWRIAMPLATPVIALVGFFNFVGNWNNYFLPFVMVPGREVARCRLVWRS